MPQTYGDLMTTNLHAAKKNKNDEFYTQYSDIEKEIEAHLEYNPNLFKNKIIHLPCDDPEWSNFTKYFSDNFQRLNLQKVVSTSFSFEGKGKVGVIDKNGVEWHYLEDNGDFRSEEVCLIRDGADMIITNPPFSMFKFLVPWIGDKEFLIIGNINAVTYKEIFKLIKDNKLWWGYNANKTLEFRLPDHYTKWKYLDEETGRKYGEVSGITWYTNFTTRRRNEPLILYKNYTPEQYPTYDNYDAIEVSKVKDIPYDYYGVMGVPITFLDKFCPNQFEIIALGIVGSCEFTCNKKMEILKNNLPTGKFTKNAKGTLYLKHNSRETKPPAFKNVETGELYASRYARILIKRKQY